jgi:hypothetical protein
VPRALWLIVGGAIAEVVRERSGAWMVLVGVELGKLSDDLRRQADIWARSAVAGREPANATSTFAGL